ncbi:MAG: divalent-cation tolerance protein CutA [Alphaproteobacteria bacterium]
MTHSVLYITASDMDEAKTVARSLVEARLAACANVIGAMESFYWWQGKLEEAREVVIIAKTRDDLVEAAVAKVREVHSYDLPCVVAVAITGGNPEFLDWITDETAQ